MSGARVVRGSAAGWLLGILAIIASAQDLVVDGGFSTAPEGWQVTGDGTASPAPDDIDGDPASGSALLRNALVDAGTRTHPLAQCVVTRAPPHQRWNSARQPLATQT